MRKGKKIMACVCILKSEGREKTRRKGEEERKKGRKEGKWKMVAYNVACHICNGVVAGKEKLNVLGMCQRQQDNGSSEAGGMAKSVKKIPSNQACKRSWQAASAWQWHLWHYLSHFSMATVASFASSYRQMCKQL